MHNVVIQNSGLRLVQVGIIDDDVFAEVEHALFRHKMIYLRDQDMTHDVQQVLTHGSDHSPKVPTREVSRAMKIFNP